MTAQSRTMRGFQLAVLAFPLAVAAGAGWAHRKVVDDGFIYFRTVNQITGGHGPVFNVGERVESFTSPLWVALLSVADVVTPVRLEWLAVSIGLVGSVVGLGLAMAGARHAAEHHRTDDTAPIRVEHPALRATDAAAHPTRPEGGVREVLRRRHPARGRSSAGGPIAWLASTTMINGFHTLAYELDG